MSVVNSVAVQGSAFPAGSFKEIVLDTSVRKKGHNTEVKYETTCKKNGNKASITTLGKLEDKCLDKINNMNPTQNRVTCTWSEG